MTQRLPTGWASGPLSEFVEPRGVKASPESFPELPFIGMDHVEAHTTRITGTVPAGHMKSTACRFWKDDVLYGRLRPYLNKVAQPPFDGLASAEFMVFNGNDLIDSRFLKLRLNARDFCDFASHLNEGDRPRVNFQQIGAFEIQAPPLNEQRRIVEKIETLFAEIDKGVECLKAAKSALDLYRKSLLKSAFEGRLTAEWRERNPNKLESPEALLARISAERKRVYQAAFDDWKRAVAAWTMGGKLGRKPTKPRFVGHFNLPLVPNDAPWPCVRVQVLLRERLANGKSVKAKAGGFPVLRLTALKRGKIDLGESKEGDWDRAAAIPYLVERDDIFLARGNGSKRLVGIGGRVVDDPPPVAFPDTMIRLRLNRHLVRMDYFLLVWNSLTVREQIESAARTTAGIYKINQGHVSKFTLPLPSLAEQTEVAKVLNTRIAVAQELAKEIDAALSRAEILRQSILKKAFAGKLIPQDPNEEPAQALLARIAASRAGKAATKPRKTSRRRRHAARQHATSP